MKEKILQLALYFYKGIGKVNRSLLLKHREHTPCACASNQFFPSEEISAFQMISLNLPEAEVGKCSLILPAFHPPQ
jgi:hypothetical protein